MIKYLPNTLTFLRVVAIPFFIYFMLIDKHLVATLLFIFASISDYYDGYFARKLNIVSNFGKLMDPLADKFLVLAALVLLSLYPIQYLHWVVVAIIAIRELFVTIIRYIYKKQKKIIAAGVFGKYKTGFQLGAIITSLVVYTALQYECMSFLRSIESELVLFLKISFWLIAAFTVICVFEVFKTSKEE